MSATFTIDSIVTHHGIPDGSAGVMVGQGYFVAACDEDNILRLFTTDGSRPPRALIDLDPLLGFESKKKKARECDIEGAARLGNLIYWIGSHGRNKDGEVRENRRVLLATELHGSGGDTTLKMTGRVCTGLLEALFSDVHLEPFRLEAASQKAPKDEGALNIEALCDDGDSLLIGFRNPVPAEGALVVPLLNPRETIEGKFPKFGAPILLPLGGLGIRDMAKWNDGFLIIAGSYREGRVSGAEASSLWMWNGEAIRAPERIDGNFGDLNPEAILVDRGGSGSSIVILSDDGGDHFRSVKVTIHGAK